MNVMNFVERGLILAEQSQLGGDGAAAKPSPRLRLGPSDPAAPSGSDCEV